MASTRCMAALCMALALGVNARADERMAAVDEDRIASVGAAELAPAPPESLLALPAELRDLLRQRVGHRGSHSQSVLLDALARLLFDADGLGMRYRHDASFSAARAFATREANCLGFTLLSLALARELGLDAYGQEVSEGVSWRREGETVFRTQHINTGVRIGGKRFSIDVAANEILILSPPRQVSDQRLLSHYYNNRLAELMAMDALEAADAHARIGLELDSENPALWSNVGVLRSRQQRAQEAEQAWLQALELDARHAAAITNLASLYRRQGNARRAEALDRRLRAVQATDPFHQFVLGLEYEAAGNARLASRQFRRAIRLHPYEHRFYFGLARAYMAERLWIRAGRALEKALALSEGDARGAYAAKLEWLRETQHN
jgi:tetratricopeptide (TPR) repeat protein